jgi:predicted DNA-binding ribbon-helix-helix protein
VRRRRYEVTEIYALIEISNQMLEFHADPDNFAAFIRVAVVGALVRVAMRYRLPAELRMAKQNPQNAA